MNRTEKKVGRPSKLTLELQDEFVEYIKMGDYIETACALVGINKSTYYDWMKKADESSRYTKYKRFKDAVEHAQAVSEARDVIIISEAAISDWRAARWMLEHRFTEHWGIPSKVKNGNMNTLKQGGADNNRIDKANIIEAMDSITKK